MNYLEKVARSIWSELGEEDDYQNDHSLWLFYALLALTTGTGTTNENVHDAWSAWTCKIGSHNHPSLVPFSDLSPKVQELDSPYRDAIIRVAGAL